jgi:hypothetical protein
MKPTKQGKNKMIKIVIQTNADFTPKGKRNAKIVTLNNSGFGKCQRIRWYVSGKIFRTLPVSQENINLTQEWMAA